VRNARAGESSTATTRNSPSIRGRVRTTTSTERRPGDIASGPTAASVRGPAQQALRQAATSSSGTPSSTTQPGSSRAAAATRAANGAAASHQLDLRRRRPVELAMAGHRHDADRLEIAHQRGEQRRLAAAARPADQHVEPAAHAKPQQLGHRPVEQPDRHQPSRVA
jgi:hypothetical protein